ncbi:hypothetical protein P9112_008941 [Eukaryota sp. TZLM1-RC]
MCKSNHIEAFVKPLVCKLSPENEVENTFGKRRADLITPGSDGVIKVVDVVTVDVCKDSAIDFAKQDETPLCFAEKSKMKRRVEHVSYQLVPFDVSLFGNIGISGIKFLKGFKSLKERAGEELNFNFWHNRIVFIILKAIPEMITKALLQLEIEYENRALKRLMRLCCVHFKIKKLNKKKFMGISHNMSKLIDVTSAIAKIADGSTVVTSGFVSCAVPNYFCSAFEQYYLEHQSPRDLTLIYAAGQGDGKTEGLNHFAQKGCLSRVIGGHYGLAPSIGKLAFAGEIDAYNFPQGVISNSYRCLARREPFVLSRIGLHTFVDPRVEGGKVNSHNGEDLVSLINIDDHELLKFKIPNIDVAILRGTVADEAGNVSLAEDCVNADVLPIAMAAHNNGGLVFVEVKRIVKKLGDVGIGPHDVTIPSIFVDHIIEIPEEHQFHTFKTKFNPDFITCPTSNTEDAPLGDHPTLLRSIVGSRAAQEFTNIKENPVVNVGIGMAEDAAYYANLHGIPLINTVEVGPYGGVPMSGKDFGAMIRPQAILAQHQMFDAYQSGTFLDVAFLGLAEVDERGNLNVSKFGTKLAGCGGFIDIAQSVPLLVFVGTFTASGLSVTIEYGKLKILKEGKLKKFVRNVQQITFSSKYAKEAKQKVLYITERAVFELINERLVLHSVAPGVDLQRDVLKQMDFEPVIPNDGVVVDEDYFKFLDLEYFVDQ